MTSERRDSAALFAFLTGALLGAGITLLMTPKPGKEVREKLGEAADDALQKVREGAREAKFKMSKKTPADAFRYDGGDCWI